MKKNILLYLCLSFALYSCDSKQDSKFKLPTSTKDSSNMYLTTADGTYVMMDSDKYTKAQILAASQDNTKKYVTTEDGTYILINPYQSAEPGSTQTAASRLEEAKTMNDLLLFVKDFTTVEFQRSRTDLIDGNIDNGYSVSEMKEKGNSLSFELKFNDFEGTQIYTCTPDMGTNTMSFFGDREVVKDFFEKTKLSEEWKQKNVSEVGESVESIKPWDDKRITTHSLATYTTNGDNEASLMYKRVLVIKTE